MSESRRLGQYELHEELGHGGFATVYRATHITLQNEVALKVIDPGRAGDKNTRERLIREAQVASQLEHPHIVRVFDMDEDQGQVFIAMEYVRGGDLSDWLANNRPVNWRKGLAILGQVAAALDYAHQQNVLHRDVKPNNILIGAKGNAHLSDFGLVRALDTPRLTRVGSVVGTPAYMSPEQVEDHPITGKTDQYSLALVAYELFVGYPPFNSDTSTPALLLMQIEETPPRPSHQNPQVPQEADEVLLKALSKKPEERYATCAEFVRALEAAFNTSELRRYREFLNEARSRMSQAEYDTAQAKLEAAATLFPDRDDLQVLQKEIILRRYQSLLTEAQTSIVQGEYDVAQAKLNAAAILIPGRDDLQALLQQLEETRLQAEVYQQGVQSWQLARQQAQNVLDLFPDYPDPHEIFVTLGLRPRPRSRPSFRHLAIQGVIGLLVGGSAFALFWYLAFLWITR